MRSVAGDLHSSVASQDTSVGVEDLDTSLVELRVDSDGFERQAVSDAIDVDEECLDSEERWYPDGEKVL